MALSQSTLKDELKSALDEYPESVADSAAALAGAYHAYAGDAEFATATPVLTGRDSALASALQSGMTGTFAAFASAWSTGLTAYWTGVVVEDTEAGLSGATIPPPGAASIPAALASAFDPYPTTTASAADKLATALHTATATTTSTLVPPPGTIVPVT